MASQQEVTSQKMAQQKTIHQQQRRTVLGLLVSGALLLTACGRSAGKCLLNKKQALENLRPFADKVLGKAALSAAQGLKPEALAVWQSTCEAALAERIREQAAADFVAQKTIKLDGWIVSETEAAIHRAVYLAGERPNDGLRP